METKATLKTQIQALGIMPHDTLLIHSSLSAIGSVEGGGETVLEAFIEYLAPGLLVLPTHTWRQINAEYNVFSVDEEPSCVGVLTELFRKRPGVVRSWHPTHSVAALGQDAEEFIRGEEFFDSPCPREGCWGKLYDREAKILFLGIDLSRNTMIHGVEEWAKVSNRLTEEHQALKIRTPDGRLLDCPMRRHQAPVPDISKNYGKLAAPLFARGIAKTGQIGQAESILVRSAPMVDWTMEFLRKDPDLFIDRKPIPTKWYAEADLKR